MVSKMRLLPIIYSSIYATNRGSLLCVLTQLRE